MKARLWLSKLGDGTGGEGGSRGATGPSIFGRSVNHIPTGEGQIIPTYYYWHPQCF